MFTVMRLKYLSYDLGHWKSSEVKSNSAWQSREPIMELLRLAPSMNMKMMDEARILRGS